MPRFVKIWITPAKARGRGPCLYGDGPGIAVSAALKVEAELGMQPLQLDAHELTLKAASQIEHLEPTQLAIWISAAPDPQRTALALFYLNEFDYREILDLTELKLNELSRLLALGRRQFQAWLDAMLPQRPGL